MKKISHIEQGEHSECALACINMILDYYGFSVTLLELREKFGVPKGGLTIKNIYTIFRFYHFKISVFRVDETKYFEIPTPSIAYWNNQHFVVIEKILNKKIIIDDPASGKKIISIEEFKESFSNIIIYSERTKVKSRDKNKRMFRDFLFHHFKFYFLKLTFLSLLYQSLLLLIPIMTRFSIDNFEFLTSTSGCIIIIILLLYVIILYLVQFLKNFVISEFQYNFDLKIMDKFIDKLLNMPLTFFCNRSTGELIFRSSINIYIRQILSQNMVNLVIDSIFLIIYFILMIKYSLLLTWIVCIFISIICIISFINSKKIKSYVNREIYEQGKVQRVITEAIEGIETIKAVKKESYFFSNWNKNFEKQLLISKQKNQYIAKFGILPEILQNCIPVFLIIAGIKLISRGMITSGILMGYLTLLPLFMNPVLGLVGFYNDFQLLNIYFNKILEIMYFEKNQTSKTSKFNFSKTVYELKEVSFRHSIFEDEVLKKISFSINRGEKIAIVGPSGSGKSTLLKIMAGLMKPSNGNLLYNGIDLFASEEALNDILLINQNAYIFNETVERNITLDFNDNNLSYNKKNEQLLYESMCKAKVDQFLESIPLFSKTIISENGRNFSGGEKQKISLCRAFYSNASTLLLDEPTSAIDNISEKEIFRNLKKDDRTVIVVAHRLSTIRNFDKIILMINGKIDSIGTHEYLLNNNKLYQKLYSESSKGDEKTDE